MSGYIETSMMLAILSILALGLLMVVHEGGHFFVARLFKMRVIKYSIGFGPVLWSKKPEGSETTYQIALLPFLAYVQIAGMNPHEEIDPNDKGSYANASWAGRFLTIIAGPVANYLLAVVLFFGILMISGRSDPSLRLQEVNHNTPAEAAQLHAGDEVQSIDSVRIKDFTDMRAKIQAHRGVEMTMVLVRDGAPITVKVTPTKDEGVIGIKPAYVRRSVSFSEAGRDALVEPPRVAWSFVEGFGRLIRGKEKVEPMGPIRIVEEARDQFKKGAEAGIEFFAVLSIYLFVFNLLPVPALDGGRLAFLLYEFLARRRPDAKVEARVHMVGLLAMLSLFIPLFFVELWKLGAKIFLKG
ncbi:MAG: RIP metalloprotease RseP [Polyangiales bacterium]